MATSEIPVPARNRYPIVQPTTLPTELSDSLNLYELVWTSVWQSWNEGTENSWWLFCPYHPMVNQNHTAIILFELSEITWGPSLLTPGDFFSAAFYSACWLLSWNFVRVSNTPFFQNDLCNIPLFIKIFLSQTFSSWHIKCPFLKKIFPTFLRSRLRVFGVDYKNISLFNTKFTELPWPTLSKLTVDIRKLRFT
jgi:hypothetical protein